MAAAAGDFDNDDGYPDLFVANDTEPKCRFQLVWLASSEAGLQRQAAHRGAAMADVDNRRMDVVVTALGECSSLLQNQPVGGSHWLLVKLRGNKSNNEGLGAVLKVETEDGCGTMKRHRWGMALPAIHECTSV
jgi:hypothetical protein